MGEPATHARRPLSLGLQVQGERYAVRSARVIEVIPRVALRAVAAAPPEVAGLCVYRGSVVPVVDLVRLLAGVPCADRLSSRIVIFRLAAEGGERLVGLMAEGVAPFFGGGDEVHVALRLADAPWLGDVLRDGEQIVQLIEPEHLLPVALLAMLLDAKTVSA